MYLDPLFIETSYLCEIADEQLLWRNYNRVFDKLYVFYCIVGRNFLHTFYFRSGKKCCCTVICEHGSFYWIVGNWFGKNGFERKRKRAVSAYLWALFGFYDFIFAGLTATANAIEGILLT